MTSAADGQGSGQLLFGGNGQVGLVLNGRYELIEKVGQGGMGICYRARDRLLEREVAVKVMAEQLGGDPAFVERFSREAKAAARLAHENIAAVYDTGCHAGRHYIVMEFVEGEDLCQLLRREGPLAAPRAADIARQVARALAFAHSRGVLHLDIKPQNIRITPDGRAKVTDFGLARLWRADSASSETGPLVGSAFYFSPEQARGLAVGRASDLYSLGVALFEMLTGRRPFEGENPIQVAHKHIYDMAPSPRALNPDVPPELAAITLRLLEKRSEARYPSAEDLLAALDVAPGAQAEPSVWTYKAPTGRGRSRAKLYGFLALAVAVAGGGSFAFLRQTEGKFVATPDLYAMSAASARRALLQNSLRFEEAGSVFSDVAAGCVVRQAPLPTARIRRGQIVQVWLSMGPKFVSIPEVSQMSLRRARLELLSRGFRIRRDERVSSESVPEGYVVRTDPPSGARVEKDARVTVFVSSGPMSAENAEQEPAEEAPGGEGQPRAGTRKISGLFVPDDVGSGTVRVEVKDSRGKRTVYEAPHKPGDVLPDISVVADPGAKVTMYVDDQQVTTMTLDEASPGSSKGEAP
jgi:serine/threonine-protein kinase